MNSIALPGSPALFRIGRIFITAMGPCPLPTYGSAAQHHTEWAHRGERRHGSSVSLRLQLYLAATGPAPTSLSCGFPFTNPPWQVASHKLPNVTLWGRLLNAKYVEVVRYHQAAQRRHRLCWANCKAGTCRPRAAASNKSLARAEPKRSGDGNCGRHCGDLRYL